MTQHSATAVPETIGTFDEGRLADEVAAIEWMRNKVQADGALPIGEARMVLASLRSAMRIAGPGTCQTSDATGFSAALMHVVNHA